MERQQHTRKMFGRIQAWVFFLHPNVVSLRQRATHGRTGIQIQAERELIGMTTKHGMAHMVVILYMPFGREVPTPTAIIIATQAEIKTMTIRQDIIILVILCLQLQIFQNMFQMAGVCISGRQVPLLLQ